MLLWLIFILLGSLAYTAIWVQSCLIPYKQGVMGPDTKAELILDLTTQEDGSCKLFNSSAAADQSSEPLSVRRRCLAAAGVRMRDRANLLGGSSQCTGMSLTLWSGLIPLPSTENSEFRCSRGTD